MMTAGLGVVLGVAACMGSSQGFRGGKFGSWFADNKVKDKQTKWKVSVIPH